MRVVARIDAGGLYVEDVLLADGAPLPASHIESRPPQGFYRPKWSGSVWEEGKPASEIFGEAKAQKEAELRDAADSWYRANVRSFEGAVVIHKIDRGLALNAEEQAIRDAMNTNYTKLKNLISQVRDPATDTIEEVRAIQWT